MKVSKKILFIAAMICYILWGHVVSYAQMTNSAMVSVRTLGMDHSGMRAAREFSKRHGEGRNETWYKLPAGYLAEFKEGSIQDKAVFDRTGGWLYSIREYSEKELPGEVRGLVKSTYYDFSITWVKEVSQYQALTYVVHIENAKEWKDLLVQDGEMVVQKSYER